MTDDISNNSVEGLVALCNTTVAVIQQLESVLFHINNTKEDPSQPASTLDASSRSNLPHDSADFPSTTDCLTLAHDSASLIKAHSTKLSLFMVTDPFTPSAIIKVLRELVSGAIPSLASACQACTAEKYTLTFRRDISWKAYMVLKDLRELVELMPRDGKVLSAAQKDGSTKGSDKGSLLSTGVVWAACDELMRFCKAGVGGCFIAKAEELKATIQDVMDELKEWGEEVPDEDDEDDFGDEDEDKDSALGSMLPSTQEMVDDIMGSSQTIPRDDPDNIRPRLDVCLKRLKLATLLFQAIIKRRFKVLPTFPVKDGDDVAGRLNDTMRMMKSLPHRFDELAGAFYELNADEIDRQTTSSFQDVVTIADKMAKPWDKERDEFTDWAGKFKEQMTKH